MDILDSHVAQLLSVGGFVLFSVYVALLLFSYVETYNELKSQKRTTSDAQEFHANALPRLTTNYRPSSRRR